jgi:hypothetical protein
MMINEKSKIAMSAYLEKHMVYCPGCNKRFHPHRHPASVAEMTISQTDYLFLLDNDCSSEFFGSSNKRRDVITARIERRMQEQPDIYCPQELMATLKACFQSEDGKPEIVVELGDPEWKSSDRAWFLDHPGRTHRLRKRYPEEKAPPADWVIVRCLTPGVRQRVPVPFIDAAQAVLLSDNEDALHRLLDLHYDQFLGKTTSEHRDRHIKTLLNGLKPDGNNVKAK